MKNLNVHRQVSGLWYVLKMKRYSAKQRERLLTHPAAWMNLLSERRWTDNAHAVQFYLREAQGRATLIYSGREGALVIVVWGWGGTHWEGARKDFLGRQKYSVSCSGC